MSQNFEDLGDFDGIRDFGDCIPSAKEAFLPRMVEQLLPIIVQAQLKILGQTFSFERDNQALHQAAAAEAVGYATAALVAMQERMRAQLRAESQELKKALRGRLSSKNAVLRPADESNREIARESLENMSGMAWQSIHSAWTDPDRDARGEFISRDLCAESARGGKPLPGLVRLSDLGGQAVPFHASHLLVEEKPLRKLCGWVSAGPDTSLREGQHLAAIARLHSDGPLVVARIIITDEDLSTGTYSFVSTGKFTTHPLPTEAEESLHQLLARIRDNEETDTPHVTEGRQ